MVASAVAGIDLFKIAGRSISGWIKGRKHRHGSRSDCQLEERRLL